MELERSNSTVVVSKTELFLCFSSSSSMKISSKSILSPGRPRDQPITLTTSLSRRLRTSGSIKGAQSPMFPNIAGKKRGSVFENPEPSSPKVTCIGQVRVKTKKKGRKMRTLSRRRNDAGEVSFRTGDSRQRNNNQRWVHLPLTICEALRGIGADFNCLFPCRSSRNNHNQNQNLNPNPKSSSCGAVFERWFVTIDDEGKGVVGGGCGGGREIELVVGDDETENTLLKERKRHSLEMFIEEDDDDEPRVSICIPPKNALLLMRCRSDPVQMEALSTRLFENPVHEQEEEEEEEAAENGVPVVVVVEDDAETEEEMNDEKKGSGYSSEADAELVKLLESDEEEEEEEEEITDFSLLFSEESNSNLDANDDDDYDEKTEDPLETTSTHETSPSEEDQRLDLSEEDEQEEEKEIPAPTGDSESSENNKILPDCLLLMMCEPKLSMEVSKETWVCSTDFIRRPFEKPSIAGTDNKKRVIRNIPPLPPPAAVIQPPRSSCTLPSKSMAAMIEQKLINAVGYEPFVLTRCKSEPMRRTTMTAAAGKLAPESCFWKNRKLEPLRRATLGIGAGGIGF